ncbi:MAG: hypothetical protein ACKOT0_06615 [bacterium]
MSSPHEASGRGLVVSGAIVVVLYLVPTLALVVWFVSGLVGGGDVAASMIFPFWLMGLLALTPLWIIGILLLGFGRRRQRGPVKGDVAAWIVAIAGIPAIGVLFGFLLSLIQAMPSGEGVGLSQFAFVAFVISIPVLFLAALAAGAWLAWGSGLDDPR